MKTTILKYTIALAGVVTLSGCGADDSFLDQSNTYQLSQENFFTSDEAVSQALLPLYNYVWYMFNDKSYYGMGDGRSNNITAQYSDYIYPYTNFTESGASNGLNDAWVSFYTIVAQANNTINNIQNYSSSGVSQTAKTQGVAEARFMRGLAYWYVGSLWGCGVLYENTQELVNNYNVPASSRTDIFEFAIRDMEYAAVNLPASSPASGRVNKYAAYAMLSRLYLSMAGVTTTGRYDGTNIQTNFISQSRNPYYLNAAKKAALKVINEGPYQLLGNYASLFDYKTQNNNSESIFQLQWQSGAPAGLANSMTRFLAWSTRVNTGNSWGGSTYCSYDLWKEFKEYNDKTLDVTIDDPIRRHYSVASYGEVYPEFSTDPEKPYIYGETESAGSQGANIKKYVIGTNAVNGIAANNNSGINTYMMRLAEVYLNYVDACLEYVGTEVDIHGTEIKLWQTTDATALELFNAIRQRAGMPTKSKGTYEELRHEDRVELAFEGL